jgi:hypothetical protein
LLSEIKAQEHNIKNLHDPFQLDIAQDDDWTGIRTKLSSSPAHDEGFSGVVMCMSDEPNDAEEELRNSKRDSLLSRRYSGARLSTTRPCGDWHTDTSKGRVDSSLRPLSS